MLGFLSLQAAILVHTGAPARASWAAPRRSTTNNASALRQSSACRNACVPPKPFPLPSLNPDPRRTGAAWLSPLHLPAAELGMTAAAAVMPGGSSPRSGAAASAGSAAAVAPATSSSSKGPFIFNPYAARRQGASAAAAAQAALPEWVRVPLCLHPLPSPTCSFAAAAAAACCPTIAVLSIPCMRPQFIRHMCTHMHGCWYLFPFPCPSPPPLQSLACLTAYLHARLSACSSSRLPAFLPARCVEMRAGLRSHW